MQLSVKAFVGQTYWHLRRLNEAIRVNLPSGFAHDATTVVLLCKASKVSQPISPLIDTMSRRSKELRYLNASEIPRHRENLKAATLVLWDIKACPVPPGFDPCRVGPCIKRFLQNKGYSGPLTITAAGLLLGIRIDILRGLLSGGVDLVYVADGSSYELGNVVIDFVDRNSPPASIVVISDASADLYHSPDSDIFEELRSRGYEVFLCDDSLRSFFLADSGAVEEDKCRCSETSESAFWSCYICDEDLCIQGFVEFAIHLNSWRHIRKISELLPYHDTFTSY